MSAAFKKIFDYCLWKIRHRFQGKQACFTVKPSVWNGKRVLLSYVLEPFVRRPWKGFPRSHQNRWEAFEMARIFTELGYKVDVINYDNNKFIPRKSYSFIIDDHDNLERLSPLLNEDCVKVIHLTRFHWLELSLSELNRLKELRDRRGIMLKPRRLPKAVGGIEFADHAVIYNNDVAKSSYGFAVKTIHSIYSSSDITYPWQEKDYARCRKHFIWFGGSGAVLKGLDLVLEAFSKMPELKLTVCGSYLREKDFVRLFHKELFETDNIISIGRVKPTSSYFKEILDNSIAIVYPSASDTNPGSVALAMHGGLIPILSKECGIDVANSGILLKECTVDDIAIAARKISSLDVDVLRTMSKNSWEYANTYNTRERFAEDYRCFVKEVLKA